MFVIVKVLNRNENNWRLIRDFAKKHGGEPAVAGEFNEGLAYDEYVFPENTAEAFECKISEFGVMTERR